LIERKKEYTLSLLDLLLSFIAFFLFHLSFRRKKNTFLLLFWEYNSIYYLVPFSFFFYINDHINC
jgi:hypothetical protein